MTQNDTEIVCFPLPPETYTEQQVSSLLFTIILVRLAMRSWLMSLSYVSFEKRTKYSQTLAASHVVCDGCTISYAVGHLSVMSNVYVCVDSRVCAFHLRDGDSYEVVLLFFICSVFDVSSLCFCRYWPFLYSSSVQQSTVLALGKWFSNNKHKKICAFRQDICSLLFIIIPWILFYVLYLSNSNMNRQGLMEWHAVIMH